MRRTAMNSSALLAALLGALAITNVAAQLIVRRFDKARRAA